ncbi:hypothetical protein CWB99_19870 [Pseudoalteromonas rubra]|uniref:Uncharacterized protein n=1 Tax=Pseudoalteromonas rubra TaxID=43658 RepID=A0A5S3WH41_9GAMM|nr:hypothetical protein CWB99_19870 [Pseudoalteromonas rubra]TMP28455.1 hypothetical protein CWC00_21350 [Pseudoalteromonas rubra]
MDLASCYGFTQILNKLDTVRVEVGNKDEYSWIAQGNQRLRELSKISNSKVQVEVFEGDHSSLFGERISERVLPHFVTLFSKQTKLYH